MQRQNAKKNYIGIVTDTAEEDRLAGSSARAQPRVVSYLIGRLAAMLKRPGKAGDARSCPGTRPRHRQIRWN
ncbi:hypothetical protein [Bradyrhizobium cajani]|uniref:Uncharacterized protein n=1 Tax=Bradyrhizobium cajani TaxID=1928661 RepID=A0A844TCX6_9BRAD|nr:hypothetical protein [Bradyrhizobium cajani]MCP3370400.1 hypothetical protein [Bradyrhizobium cajani]MVT72881.1 hypothetical protein [Bradyrhizobium cajani]